MSKIGLYVLSFNSPKQFQALLQSMIEYDQNFLNKPVKKVLLDNSTDLSTTPLYLQICSKYGFVHIKKKNLGICGGRQFLAEHFATTDLDYMLFFEDDMLLYKKDGEICKNGFNRYVPDFLNKIVAIAEENKFDFLKLSFTEFFGDNSIQWAWYNVPQSYREQVWPDKPHLPTTGFNPSVDAPRTLLRNIRSYQGIPYAIGEIYYCNWPQLVSKSGNKKIMLNTKWANPYEQTWMSHIFMETRKGNVHAGVLLLSPIEHNRFEHYDAKIRKEN